MIVTGLVAFQSEYAILAISYEPFHRNETKYLTEKSLEISRTKYLTSKSV
jgi:hypothetical protein